MISPMESYPHYPRVEAYRLELEQTAYEPLSEQEAASFLAAFRRASAIARAEGDQGSQEFQALFAMLMAARVPMDLMNHYLDRFERDCLDQRHHDHAKETP